MSKKTTTITMVIVALVTLAIVATVIIFAVKNGKQPEEPVEPSTDITTPPEKPDDPDPVIPPIDSSSGTETGKPEDSKPGTGDVHIDVEQPVDGSRDDKPGIDGDVAVIPGVKEDTE